MLYKKPKNVTYTQMAIAIDNMCYSDNCNDELLFEYLYHLSYMLAIKNRYFNSSKLYDDFAAYCATSVFLRLKNKKQYEINPKTNQYKLTKIKSVLNYLKQTLYFRKVNFEQEHYCQTVSYEEDLENEVVPTYTFGNLLSSMTDKLSRVEFECCLGDVINSFKCYLKQIPYKYKSCEWYNIYLSCLLTFINSITLSFKDKYKLSNLKYRIGDFELLNEYYSKQDNEVILYHLDDTMRDYILILVRTIKHIIAKDLSEELHFELNTYNLNDVVIYNEINTNYNEV